MSKSSRWIVRNHKTLGFLFATIAPVAIGFYTNVYTGIATQETTKGLIDAVQICRWWNVLLPVFFIALYAQFRLGTLPEQQFDQVRAKLVCRVLAAACRSLVYPRKLEDAHMRAIVSLIDTAKQKRVAKYSFNAEPDPERQGEWPINFGVTGEAISGRQVVLKELPIEHFADYTDDVRIAVLDQIRTVLAAPIFDPANRRGPPLGVVAFDSILEIKELGFDHREIRNLAQSWADVLTIILTRHDIADEVE